MKFRIYTNEIWWYFYMKRMEKHKEMLGHYAFYEHIQEGLDDVVSGCTTPFDAFMDDLRKEMKNEGFCKTIVEQKIHQSFTTKEI